MIWIPLLSEQVIINPAPPCAIVITFTSFAAGIHFRLSEFTVFLDASPASEDRDEHASEWTGKKQLKFDSNSLV